MENNYNFEEMCKATKAASKITGCDVRAIRAYFVVDDVKSIMDGSLRKAVYIAQHMYDEKMNPELTAKKKRAYFLQKAKYYRDNGMLEEAQKAMEKAHAFSKVA